MDQAVSQFFTQGAILLAIGVVVGTHIVRRIVETAAPSIKKKADVNTPSITYPTSMSRWWHNVILEVLPVALGILISVMDVPFFINGNLTTVTEKIFFGGAVGWMSTLNYKIFRRLIKKKTGVDLTDSYHPPGV